MDKTFRQELMLHLIDKGHDLLVILEKFESLASMCEERVPPPDRSINVPGYLACWFERIGYEKSFKKLNEGGTEEAG